MNRNHRLAMVAAGLALIAALICACGAATPSRSGPTPTPTRTPKVALATPSPAATPDLALRTVAPTSMSTAIPAPATPVPATSTVIPPLPSPTTSPTAQPTEEQPTRIIPTVATAPTSTPSLDFIITELRVLGLGENNGGIEGAGAGRTIFINVTDASGAPIDDARIVNTAGYPGEARSGDKGPGKAEILMDREVFRLMIAAVGGSAVTSETSHNLSLMDPVPSDIAGKLGDTCPTIENCPLPPWKHFSYLITFQRTY